MSSFFRITIISNRFASTASCSPKTNAISCQVKPLSRLSRWLHDFRLFPIPRLLRLVLFILNSLTRRGWIILALGVAAFFALDSFLFGGSHKNSGLLSNSYYGILMVHALVMSVLFMVNYFVMVRVLIASWHGAEHMAIAAYQRNCSTALADIAKESPVHSHCGGRLFFPSIIVGGLAAWLVAKFNLNELATFLVAYEVTLWVDTLVGWHKIPVAAQASRVFQKYITTREPSELELQTAQRAMEELLAAHAVLDLGQDKPK